MRAASSFTEILDAELAALTEDLAAQQADLARIFPPYATPFVHAHAPSRPAAAPYRITPDAPRSEPAARPARPRPGRASHDLSPAQRRALLELVECGAELCDNFSAADLRKTFKDLALRYHPDRHPHASTADQARLAATFARVYAGYRVLLKKVS